MWNSLSQQHCSLPGPGRSRSGCSWGCRQFVAGCPLTCTGGPLRCRMKQGLGGPEGRSTGRGQGPLFSATHATECTLRTSINLNSNLSVKAAVKVWFCQGRIIEHINIHGTTYNLKYLDTWHVGFHCILALVLQCLRQTYSLAFQIYRDSHPSQ